MLQTKRSFPDDDSSSQTEEPGFISFLRFIVEFDLLENLLSRACSKRLESVREAQGCESFAEFIIVVYKAM